MGNIFKRQTSKEGQTMSQEASSAASGDQSFLRELSSSDQGGYDVAPNSLATITDGMSPSSSLGDLGTTLDMTGTLATDEGLPLRPEDIDMLTPESIVSSQGRRTFHQQPFVTAGTTKDVAPAMELRSQCTGAHLSLFEEFYARFRSSIKSDPKGRSAEKTFLELIDEIHRSIMKDVILHTDRTSSMKPGLESHRATGLLQQSFITAGITQEGALAMVLRSQCTGVHPSLFEEFYARFRSPIKTDPKDSSAEKAFLELIDEIHRSIMKDGVLHNDRTSSVKPGLESHRATGHLQRSFIHAGITQDGALTMELRSQCTGVHLSLMEEFYARFQSPIKTDPKDTSAEKDFLELIDEIHRSIMKDVVLHNNRTSSMKPGLESHRATGLQQSFITAGMTQDGAPAMHLRSECTGVHDSLWDLWLKIAISLAERLEVKQLSFHGSEVSVFKQP